MKKPSDSGKTANEGIDELPRKQFAGLASSFSLTEKLAPHSRATTSTTKPVS
jgi:hypothetical protein